MSSVERWRVWVQRCADVRALASTLGDGGRPADAQLRVLRDKLPSLLDTLVEEVRSFEHRIDLLQKMLDEQIVRRDDLMRTVPVACVLTDAQGQITNANREATLLLNRSVRSLVTRPLERYVLDRTDIERATARLEDLTGRLHLKVVVKPREKPPVPASVTIQRVADGPTPVWRWFFLPQRAVHSTLE